MRTHYALSEPDDIHIIDQLEKSVKEDLREYGHVIMLKV